MTVKYRIKCKCGSTNLKSVMETLVDASHSIVGWASDYPVVRFICADCGEEIRLGNLVDVDGEDFTISLDHIEVTQE